MDGLEANGPGTSNFAKDCKDTELPEEQRIQLTRPRSQIENQVN